MLEKSALSELAREIAVLSGLSEVFREHTIEQACLRSGVDPSIAGPEELLQAIPQIARSLQVFQNREESARRLEDISSRIRSARDQSDPLRPLHLVVTREADVAVSRSSIRDLCLRLNTSEFLMQRACTVASELVRNMVSYAGGGEFVAEVVAVGKTLRITARDRGPGIANINEILAGRYRSKTGLGLGILGVKRLSRGFRIETSSTGTLVEAELPL